MPRDSKGQLFGIGSKVKHNTCDRTCTVVGFATSAKKEDTDVIFSMMKRAGYFVYNWRDITNLVSDEKGHEDSSDLCPVDKLTVKEGVETATLQQNDGDKVVWGE